MDSDDYADLATAACALRRARLQLHCLREAAAGSETTPLRQAADSAARAEQHYVALRRRVIGC